MSVIEVKTDNFVKEVIESEKTVLVDFWAPWCGPCRMLSPIIDDIAKEHPEIKVCKINVDEQSDLASQFRIISVPTLFVIKNGEIVNQSSGLVTKAKILEML